MSTALRLVSLLLFAASVVACAPLRATHEPAPAIPRLTATEFIASDGLRLPVRRWIPAEAPRAVVVALHGFNDYSNAFAPRSGAPGTGPYLAARGFAVVAYDQRSFGRAPDPGRWPDRGGLVTDLDDIVDSLRSEFPGLPVFGLGESMGGAVLMAALAGPDPPLLSGVVLVAPAVWARRTMRGAYRGGLWLGAHLAPGIRIASSSMGRRATDNPAVLRANEQDSLFIKSTRIDAVYGLVSLMDEALASIPKIAGPVLFLYGAQDEIIPKRPTIEAMTAFAAAGSGARMAFYDQGWHMLLRDLEAETVLNDVVAFLSDQSVPLPSGAERNALLRLTEAASAE